LKEEESFIPKENVDCAWCKETRPVSDTTWFMPEPGETSVRLCDFCYENAAIQVRLHRMIKIKGDTIIELAA
jgi:hypothetical protein